MTNSKSTKRALVSSALAVFLCVAMLIGTTFAWFTDTASTSVNKIQAGTLNVGLEKWDGEKWVDVEGETINFVNKDGNGDILWEPGATFKTSEFRVVNKGNLALKYKFVISGINGDAKLNDAIDWTYEYIVADGTATSYPLDNLTSAETVLKPANVALSDYEARGFKIVGHMDEGAGNEYQGLSIDGISITVVATQTQYEYDSNSNTYDKDATLPDFWDGKAITQPTPNETDGKYHITSAAEFVAYIKNTNTGNSYVLDRDIDLGGYTIDVSSGSRVCGSNFDGKNHTVSNFTLKGGMYTSLFGYMTINESGRTIENLIVRNATVIGGAQTSVILSAANKNDAAGAATVNNCKVYDSTIIGEKKVAPIVGYTESGTITNCYAENCTVYCTDSRSEQAGKVVGYINVSGGHTDNTSDNTAENVTIITGTAPTVVSTAAQLKTALDNTGNAPSNARYILLTADIDGSEWTAIPGGSNYPAVTIDGNNHTIKNLSSCLFSSLPGRDYVFKNINFTNVNLNSASGNNVGLGVIVGEGMANGGGSYTITNCHINGGTIDGGTAKYVGGFIGFKSNGGTVKFVDCSVNNLTLKSSEESIGGFAGHLYDKVTFENCAVKGNTSVTHDGDRNNGAAKGGILVGTVYGADVKNCTIDTTVTLSNYNALETLNGGLFGRNVNGATITID